MSDGHKKSVCLIGAGPSGCAFLYNLAKLAKEGVDIPEIVCYERQADIGGMWNYTWRTGVDEFGDPVHSSMYEELWANTPKEYSEFEDFRFDEHFGKKVPSYLPRKFMLDYFKGRWKKQEFRHWIRFHHIVKSVVYDEEKDLFTVVAKELHNDRHLDPRTFTHVVVAVGHYSTPNVPSFSGMESFPGHVTHSHDIRHFSSFEEKIILIVGSGYSADDAAVQCLKYKAKKVFLSWRTKELRYNWPVDERPNLTSVEGSRVNFMDGSSAEVDEIILCTGYRHHYPFLKDELRLKSENGIWTPGLYKGVLYLQGGNNKLFYLATQLLEYSSPLFEQQAIWCLKTILAQRSLPSAPEMIADEACWRREWTECRKDFPAMYRLQTKMVNHLYEENGLTPIDVTSVSGACHVARNRDILTYRDQPCPSALTGELAPAPVRPFMESFDHERVEGFFGLTNLLSLSSSSSSSSLSSSSSFCDYRIQIIKMENCLFVYLFVFFLLFLVIV